MRASRARRRRVAAVAVATAFLAAAAACGRVEDGGGTASASPGLVSGGFFDGFGRISFAVRAPATDGGAAAARRCALLADISEERQRGLMGARSVEPYDGMVFRFDEDTTSGFHMKDTPLPLSIAWFSSDGTFVDSADMQPCLGQPSCPVFEAQRPYRFALEVPAGGLVRLGAGPGSRLVLGGDCG